MIRACDKYYHLEQAAQSTHPFGLVKLLRQFLQCCCMPLSHFLDLGFMVFGLLIYGLLQLCNLLFSLCPEV